MLTVRGCAFYVLNLLAQSGPTARERLRQLAWEATSPCPSLAAFYHQQRKLDAKLMSPVERHDHSRRLSFEEHYDHENDVDAAQGNLLSASVTSGGDILSSCSGSSPPRASSPSIFLMTSPGASRKSSQVPSYARRYRSHCSSGDAHSVLTCASCELCRRPSTGWMMSGGAAGTARIGTASSLSSLAAVASPIRIVCCEPSPPLSQQPLANGQAESIDQEDSAGNRKNTRSKSLGTADAPTAIPNTPTVVFSNFLTANNATAQKRDRTPSPKHSPISENRKISMPLTTGDSGTSRRLSGHWRDRAAASDTYSIVEESYPIDDSAQFFPSSQLDSGEQSAMANDGFFSRIEKKPDTATECVRSALGLAKTPLLPEDLPTIRGSFRRMLEKSDQSSEYISDENAVGFAAWRLLQKQQRERAMSFDAGVPTSADVVVALESGATSRADIEDDISTPLDDEQSQR